MIRLVAYNVSGGLDAGSVTAVLTALRPDVACLVETPGRLNLRRMAQAAGLQVASRAGRRRLGTAVLVGDRTRVLSSAGVALPGVAGSPDRAASHAIVGVGSLRLSVVAAQLGLRPDARLAHAEELERFLGSVDVPGVLAGDLSEPPGGTTAARFADLMTDAFAAAGRGRGETYPTPDPSARHDYVFVDRELTVERAFVPTDAPVDVASHHRPVVVELAVPDTEVDRSFERHQVADAAPEPAEPAA